MLEKELQVDLKRKWFMTKQTTCETAKAKLFIKEKYGQWTCLWLRRVRDSFFKVLSQEKLSLFLPLTLLLPGGVLRTPRNFAALGDPLTVKYIAMFMLRIPNYLFTNKISKKKDFFWGGHPFGPLKKRSVPKMTPKTTYNPYFLLQNRILL